MNLLRLALIGLELFHAMLHTQVLLGIAKVYTVEELRNNERYFIFDAVTVVSSAIFLLMMNNRRGTSHKNIQLRRLLVFANMILHLTLHAYFILNWRNDQAFWVNAIREWSAEKLFRNRMLRHGAGVGTINWFGTCFDIFAHFFMASQLVIH